MYSGYGLETINFTAIVKEDESSRHGICSVCMGDKYSKKCCISVSVQNVCARTVLTDSSNNKEQMQGTIKMQRNLIHIQFCVVAWEMEGINKIIDLFNIFNFFYLVYVSN